MRNRRLLSSSSSSGLLLCRPSRFLSFTCLFLLTLYLLNGIPLRISRARWGHASSLIGVQDRPFLTSTLITASFVVSAAPTPLQQHPTPPSSPPTAAADKMASAPSSTFSLASDLARKKEIVQQRLRAPSDDATPVMLIMGNMAGDTDSLSSAVLLAHLLTLDGDQGTYGSRFPRSTIFVPLVQQERSDLPLRAENQFLLSLLKLSPDDLLFLDDVPKPHDLQGRTDLLLGITDHPRLSDYWQPYPHFAERVQLVVDHHADDGAHAQAKVRLLKGPDNGAIGSATSVVVDMFKGDDVKERGLSILPSSLADLALAAVLIDTDNLRPTSRGGKATDVDLNAARILLERSTFGAQDGSQFLQSAIRLGGADGKVDKSSIDADVQELGSTIVTQHISADVLSAAAQYFEILSRKKLDVSRLDTHDLLRRDYKEQSVTEINDPIVKLLGGPLRAGFSSVPVGLSDWIHSRHGDDDARWSGFWTALQAWMRERKLDVAVVGTSYREGAESDEDAGSNGGKHRRELLLAYVQRPALKSPNLFTAVTQTLEQDSYASSIVGGADKALAGQQPSTGAALRLDLDAPWKGSRRVASTGKCERLGGVDKHGRCTVLDDAAANGANAEGWVAVWRQRNAKASRKVYLPAVMHALQAAARSKLA